MPQKQIGFYGRFQPTGVDTSGAQRLQALAKVADQVGEIALNVGAKKRAEQGQIAGATAGMEAAQEGKPLEQKDSFIPTFFDDAFNKAAINAYGSNIENSARVRLAEIEAEHESDVEGFSSSAKAFRNQLLTSVDPNVSPLIAPKIDGLIASYQSQVIGRQKTLANKNLITQFQTTAQTALNDAERFATNGDYEQARAALSDTLANIDNQVGVSGGLTQEQATEKKRLARQVVDTAKLRKEVFDTLDKDGVAAATARVDEVRRDIPDGYTQDEWDRAISSLDAEITRKRSIETAQASAFKKVAVAEFNKYKDAVGLGFQVTKEDQDRVATLVAGTEYEADFRELQVVQSFSVLPAAQRDAVLVKQRQAATTIDELGLLAQMEASQEKLSAMAEKDGYTLGVRQGLIEATDLDPENPESFALRAEQARMLSEHYGVEVGPFTASEAGKLSASIKAMTADEKMDLAFRIGAVPEAWQQIAENNQSVFSMMGAIGDENLMRTVFTGQEMLANKLAQRPDPSSMMPVFQEYVADVYGPDDAKAVLESAIAHYVSEVDDSTVWDDTQFKKSLEAVTGGIGKINGYKIELPRGITAYQFDEFLEGITSEVVDQLGGIAGLTNEEAADLIQESRIVSVGNNQYQVHPENNSPLYLADGNPLILSYTAELAAKVRASRHARVLRPDIAVQTAVSEGRIK